MVTGEVVSSVMRSLWSRRPIRIAVSVLLLVNLQDMSTSLTRLSQLAPKSWLQWGLLLPLVPWSAYYVPRLLRALATAPLPRPVMVMFCGVLLCQAVCALAEREVYPFSPVGMYGYPVQPQLQEWATRPGDSPDFVFHAADGGVRQLSLFREGDPLFASGALSLDMKTSWVLEKFRTRKRADVERLVVQKLSKVKYQRVERALIQVNLRTGQTQRSPVVEGKP